MNLFRMKFIYCIYQIKANQKNRVWRLRIPSGSVPQQPPICVTALKLVKICSRASQYPAWSPETSSSLLTMYCKKRNIFIKNLALTIWNQFIIKLQIVRNIANSSEKLLWINFGGQQRLVFTSLNCFQAIWQTCFLGRRSQREF